MAHPPDLSYTWAMPSSPLYLAKDNFFYDLQLRPQAITLHAGESRASWHSFYFFIFHIFSLFANLNLRAQLGSDILELQSELYNFHAIFK